jgi:uncharacterized protein YyaL (SSP411 family)
VNRLAGEPSPYLRQHADNPVDWWPWGEAARARAAELDRPLFVSIGYASCHWCHVMAHESFEDDETAALLNATFVPVKVDREERPDVDALYMAAATALTGQGGWPLSVFCTPDGRPFFAGTYFPPTDRHGLPSFRRVLTALDDAWRTQRDTVEAQAAELAGAVAQDATLADRLAPEAGADLPDFDQVLGTLAGGLAERFDRRWGGFGPAPKFPRPTLTDLCLRQAVRAGDETARTMARTTLSAMAAGGMYDHLVGGFCRYSVDATWTVPHFEKMLTDQALLARGYLHAWQALGHPDDLQVVTETLDWVLADLRAPGGGLWSSTDADAAGVEGSHATFTLDQAAAALAAGGRADLLETAVDWWGLRPAGNFEGTNVLRRPLGAPLARPAEVEEARRLLAAARAARPQPATDDKVLLEWNAMTAAVLAEAGAATASPRWVVAAEEVLDFCFAELLGSDGVWRRRAPAEGAPLALAADHAWLVEACTRVAEATGRARWLARATAVAGQLLDRFWDEGPGGLFTTAHDAEPLVARAKDVLDGAVPSANAVGAAALLRLGALTGDARAAEAGRTLLRRAGPFLERSPEAVADTAAALELTAPGAEVVVTGDRPDLVALVQRAWRPGAVLAWGEPTGGPLWAGRDERGAEGRAYVCQAAACRTPTGDPERLAAELAGLDRGRAA